MCCAGIYNDATLVGMDFVVQQASIRGIRVLIAFENYWQHYGGTDQYNRWAYQEGSGSCDGDFNCRDVFFEQTQQRGTSCPVQWYIIYPTTID